MKKMLHQQFHVIALITSRLLRSALVYMDHYDLSADTHHFHSVVKPEVFADRLHSFIQTSGNPDNLLAIQTIRRTSVQSDVLVCYHFYTTN